MNRALRSAVLSSLLSLPALAFAQPATPAPPATVPAPAASTQPAAVPAPTVATPPPTSAAESAETPAAADPSAPVPTAEAAVLAPVPAAPEASSAAPIEPEPAEPELPPRLAVGGEGFFQPGMLIQAWLLAEHVEGADVSNVTFRLRRAELSAKGEIIPKQVAYKLMIDPAKVLEPQDTELAVNDAMGDATGDTVTAKQQPKGTAISMLQDVTVSYLTEYVDIQVGQFKIPVSWEGVNSSSKLLFAERGATAREFGDKRDLGLQLSKTFEYVGYTVGFFNGAGQNNLDTNDGKDGAVRLEVYPVEGLTIGGVAYASLWDREDPGSKDRFEGDLRFERFGLLAHLEYINARDRTGADDVHAQGVSFALAYSLLDDKLQPAVRIDYLDPDTDQNVDPATGKDELVRIDTGLNWYVRKNEVKLLLNYSRFEYEDLAPINQVILASQVAF